MIVNYALYISSHLLFVIEKSPVSCEYVIIVIHVGTNYNCFTLLVDIDWMILGFCFNVYALQTY